MNFIERWLHLSPDAGDGSFEWLLMMAVAIMVGIILFRRRLVALMRKLFARHGPNKGRLG